MKKALLIIDMLNDFSRKEGSLFVPENEKIIPVISEWLEKFRKNNDYIIYICDNHSPDDVEFKKWPAHAVSGSWGAEIVEDLKPKLDSESEFIVKKTTYSSFYKTELEELLKRLGITDLYLTGCVLNICVYFCAMEATLRGLRVYVIKDGVSALNEEDKAYIYKDMKYVLGAELI
ncbi:MAG: cysteine hydrolase [Proteobacteria bacterium]|nr:cysteine hydrolase [Pseudomonadota bacterium]